MTRHDLPLALERHPLRPRILELVAAGGTLSPVALAGLLDAPLGTVAYHVRKLVELGALAPAGERRVRGAVEHFYAVTSAGVVAHDETPLEVAITALERILADDQGATVASGYAEVALERIGRRPETDRALVDALRAA